MAFVSTGWNEKYLNGINQSVCFSNNIISDADLTINEKMWN